jgi:membrane protease YdiL (CAAX protease family)
MIETLLVTAGAIAVVRLLHVSCTASLQWIVIPGVLVTAALVPAWIQKREFPRIGLDRDHTSAVAGTLGGTCLCVFPAIFLVLWLLTWLHLPVPLRPIVPERQGWFAWLLYQFFYVAVAEELFFRGYVQANVMARLRACRCLPERVPPGIAIVISAGCFALAHVLVQGRMMALLTFVPGLVLAWLFLRTGTLLAPILFHGLANVSYAMMAMTLAQP